MPSISRFRYVALGLVLGGALNLTAARFGWAIRWNHTPSIPMGIYIADSDGQFAEFCPGGFWGALSVERDYRQAGLCFDGREPLLKRIVAHDGDTVAYTDQGVAVNGKLMAASTPHERDMAGRPLQHVAWGEYVLGPGQFWLMGDHPRSFDSRYFGPVDSSQIRNRLRRW